MTAEQTLAPFRVLFDEDSSDRLPPGLCEIYGSSTDLNGRGPLLYANFVQSIDGIVALAGVKGPGGIISEQSPADRFVMGLLRAQADAVIVSAALLRETTRHQWSAQQVYPPRAHEFAELRALRGLKPYPHLAVLTASGEMDPAHPALAHGATIFTTERGRAALGDAAGEGVEIRLCGGERWDLRDVVDTLHTSGYPAVLTEAGPDVNTQLIAQGLIDDLFITVSPLIAGGAGGNRGLAAAAAFLPDEKIAARLVSARGNGDLLFLHYTIPR